MNSKQLLDKVTAMNADPLVESYLRVFAETSPDAVTILSDIEKNALNYCQAFSMSPDRMVWITNRIKEFL